MLVSPRISLSYVLRLWMEIVRPQNANVTTEFYPHEVFHEGAMRFFSKKLIFLIKQKKSRYNAPALRVLAREPG